MSETQRRRGRVGLPAPDSGQMAPLGVRRVAVASSDTGARAGRAVASPHEGGVETVSRAGPCGALDTAGQGAPSPEEVPTPARQSDSAGAEAIVPSCTDMRAAEAVARIEPAAGRPAVASTPALAMAAARVPGIERSGTGSGRLAGARVAA